MDIEDFIHNVSTHLFKSGDVVFSHGEPCDGKMYFIFSGDISIIKIRQNREHEIGTLSKGEFFGEMGLISSAPRAATIKIKSDTAKLGVIHKDNFIKLAKTSPQFLFLLLRTAIKRLAIAEKKIESLTSK